MHVAEDWVRDVAVLALKGRLDSATVPGVEAKLDATVADPDLRGLVIDFAGLDYVSSLGLRTLLKTAKQCREKGVRLAVCALHPHVREVFDISGFSSIFPIHPDRLAAVASVR
ncbi:MAG TPA: STAS domain-containing protein [Azospirillaceae bacterium]|nr:STAS domain-containing protein [Azospirillaceae bacterium]